MGKELEALYRLATRNDGNRRSDEEVDNDFRIVERALKEYETIKNAEPKEKGLIEVSGYAYTKVRDRFKDVLKHNNIETNPTKALECLENFIDECQTEMYNYAELQNGYQYEKWQYKKEQLETIKQALIQAERNRKDIELIEKVRNGKTIIFVGKGLAMMNADKYHEYLKMEEEPISKKIKKCLKEQAWDIIVKNNVNVYQFKEHLKMSKGTLDYKYYQINLGMFHSGFNINQLIEEEFNLLKEVLK